MLRSYSSRVWRLLPRRYLTSTRAEPGVVGLSADHNSREVLIGLYEKTLEAVKQIPDSAAYRANVEKITEYRLEIVNGTEDIDEIETTLNVGQLPEIIEQAEDELELIPYMAQWKPWEKDGTKPAVIEIVD